MGAFFGADKKGQLVGGCSGGDVDPYDVQTYVDIYFVYISIDRHVFIDRYLSYIHIYIYVYVYFLKIL